LLERQSMAPCVQHASKSGGEFRILDVEFGVYGKLTVMAVVTQIIRAQTLGFAYSGQHGFGTQLQILRRMAAGTEELPLFRTGRTKLEQLTQGSRSHLMHGGTNRHLHRF